MNSQPFSVVLNIFHQLGGHRFIAMTGAHTIVKDGANLTFTVPRTRGCKVNRVKITLTGRDEYTVTGYNARGLECPLVATVEGVYADNLADVVGRMIGKAMHL
jgi:hypothetical protein